MVSGQANLQIHARKSLIKIGNQNFYSFIKVHGGKHGQDGAISRVFRKKSPFFDNSDGKEQKFEKTGAFIRCNLFRRPEYFSNDPLPLAQLEVDAIHYLPAKANFTVAWAGNIRQDGKYVPLPLWKNFLGKFRLLNAFEKITGKQTYSHYQLSSYIGHLLTFTSSKKIGQEDEFDEQGKKIGVKAIIAMDGEKKCILTSPAKLYVRREEIDKFIKPSKL